MLVGMLLKRNLADSRLEVDGEVYDTRIQGGVLADGRR